jgi:uncharacterized protein (DUF924 family)
MPPDSGSDHAQPSSPHTSPQPAPVCEPADVLEFWIGAARDNPAVAREKTALWFRKDFETDRLIAERFLPTMAELREGLAHDWAARGFHERLAAIIALDQFHRNVFRDTAAAFEADALALSLALTGLVTGQGFNATEVEGLFLLLPLEHCEDADIQARCVDSFERLLARARPGYGPLVADWLDYARRHKAVIDRFGRFPHRNAALKRPSTPEEIAFLQEPGSRF